MTDDVCVVFVGGPAREDAWWPHNACRYEVTLDDGVWGCVDVVEVGGALLVVYAYIGGVADAGQEDDDA